MVAWFKRMGLRGLGLGLGIKIRGTGRVADEEAGWG